MFLIRSLLSCGLLVVGLLLGSAAPVLAAPPEYQVTYRVGFEPARGEAKVTIELRPGTGHAKRLRFSIDPRRHHGFEGDGEITLKDGRLTWRPGEGKAQLRYRYRVERRRGKESFDARITEQWALLRLDRLVPGVAVVAPGGARSRAQIVFELPPGWTAVDTPYPISEAKDGYPIDNPGRRFQRPLGWMIVGDLGVRREQFEDMHVSVAAPKGDTMRRNDVLAVINTLVPELRMLFEELPEKLLIVGAGDPMWRGGLSSPGSLFLHSDRPLISENGSSTLVHEIIHVVSGIRGGVDDDWIAEGIAEYYSIELLRRAGLLSEARAARAMSWMRGHGKRVKTLHSGKSHGSRTARAVTLLDQLDREIRLQTRSRQNLDDLVRPMVGRGRITTEELRASAEKLLGRPSKVLQTPLLRP